VGLQEDELAVGRHGRVGEALVVGRPCPARHGVVEPLHVCVVGAGHGLHGTHSGLLRPALALIAAAVEAARRRDHEHRLFEPSVQRLHTSLGGMVSLEGDGEATRGSNLGFEV
jgi:hypothetical protein